jgi:restriction system protein
MTTTLILLAVLIVVAALLPKITRKRQGIQTPRYKKNTTNKTKGRAAKFKQSDLLDAWEPAPPKPAKPQKIVWDKAFLLSIEWKLFEDVCAEYLRLKKHDARVTPIGKDGGIDLKVRDATGKVTAIGQCKAWKDAVGVSQIRELYGVMAAEKVENGIYMTTSSFTNDAWAFGRDKKLLLITGDELLRQINSMNKASVARLDKLVSVSDYNVPTCASCNVKMVKRLSPKSGQDGGAFWGCGNYPRCKNTLRVRKES